MLDIEVAAVVFWIVNGNAVLSACKVNPPVRVLTPCWIKFVTRIPESVGFPLESSVTTSFGVPGKLLGFDALMTYPLPVGLVAGKS